MARVSRLPVEHHGEHRATRAADGRRSGRRLPLKSLASVSDAQGVRAKPRANIPRTLDQTVGAVVPDHICGAVIHGIRDITDSSRAIGRLSKAHVQAGRIPTRDDSTCHGALRTLPRARTQNWRMRGFCSGSSTARRTERMVLVPSRLRANVPGGSDAPTEQAIQLCPPGIVA